MKKSCSYNFEFPVTKEKDVIVVGAGPAGCLAALSARRNGADTLLIERESCIGGMLTGGFVDSLQGFRFAQNYAKRDPNSSWDTPLLVRGISLELFTRLQKEGGTIDHGHAAGPSLREPFDPEIMKQVLDEMMEESRVEVLYNTTAFGAVVEDNVLKGVAVANKSGGQVFLGKVIVDASGDADIAVSAGVPFEKGREQDGRAHGGSLMMDIGGIDTKKYIAYLKNRPQKTPEERLALKEESSRLLGGGGTHEFILDLEGTKGWFSHGGAPKQIDWDKMDQTIEAGKNFLALPGIEDEWLEFVKGGNVPPWFGAAKLIYIKSPFLNEGPFGLGLIRHGKMRYDHIRSGVFEAYFDQTNQEEISKAISWMRKMNRIYLKFRRVHIPGFENAYIIQMQPTVGTRESRRVVGEYALTEYDCVEGKRFPDVIAKSGRAMVMHTVTGVWGEAMFVEPKKPFDIPYGCLVPKKIDNLLVAGRTISAKRLGWGFVKGEPCCMSTGEAAGAAAALSARLGVTPRHLDVKLLQKKLLDQGVLLFLEEEQSREKEISGYKPASSNLV